MNVAVVIPWRDTGCPHRAAALAWVLAQWRLTRWPVTLATVDPDGPWVKAAAVTPAVEATDADIVVVHDADVWSTGTAPAVQAVADGHPWAIPHRRVLRLTEKATADLLANADVDLTATAERPYKGQAAGGILVAPCRTLLEVPLDPRFAGWGGEDVAWSYALATLAGRAWRGSDDLVHLWHPPQDRMTRRVGNPQNEQLRLKYRAALDRPDRMRALIDQGRASWPRTSASR